MPQPTFPQTIYVTREGDGDDTYLNVRESDDFTGIDESQTCAIYELKEVGTVNVTRTFKSTQS